MIFILLSCIKSFAQTEGEGIRDTVLTNDNIKIVDGKTIRLVNGARKNTILKDITGSGVFKWYIDTPSNMFRANLYAIDTSIYSNLQNSHFSTFISSNYNSTTSPNYVYDLNTSTSWGNNLNSGMPCYWGAQFDTAKVFTTFTTYHDGGGAGSGNMRDYYVQGSNDNTTYTNLLHVINSTVPTAGYHSYPLTTTGSFTYYRLYVNSSFYNGTATSNNVVFVPELNLSYNPPDTFFKASSKGISTKYLNPYSTGGYQTMVWNTTTGQFEKVVQLSSKDIDTSHNPINVATQDFVTKAALAGGSVNSNLGNVIDTTINGARQSNLNINGTVVDLGGNVTTLLTKHYLDSITTAKTSLSYFYDAEGSSSATTQTFSVTGTNNKMYSIGGLLKIKSITGTDTLTYKVTYYDEDNTFQTLNFSPTSGIYAFTAVGNYPMGTFDIVAKTGTAISFIIALPNSGGTINFNPHFTSTYKHDVTAVTPPAP